MVTVDDVAKKAGVSKTTVSHVLSGKRHVAAKTRERIEQVIAELGFRPNALARSLRMQQTHMVAFIIPDITNPHYPVLARGLQDALVEHDYHIFLYNTDSKQEQETRFIRDAIQRRVDGIILTSLHVLTQEVQEYLDQGTIFVSAGPGIEHPSVDKVITDAQEGAKNAIRYLIQRGHRRIAMIGATPELTPGRTRLAGYREALAEADLPFDATLVTKGDFMRPGGEQAMRALMALPERPTAVFCANDLMAIGAMHTARELGIAIPDDVAIVGYDNIEAASLVSPALTTVVNPAYEVGKAAGQLLLERMRRQYQGPGRQVVVPHRLIQRESA